MPYCLLGLGSNVGNRVALLDAAIGELAGLGQVTVLSSSRYHETAAIGGPPNQGPFLNAAVLTETHLTPDGLLQAALDIERRLGRQRIERWGPRPIDIDLLLYDERSVASSQLELPHPRMAWRRFVLVPAVEVAPRMIHPTTGWTLQRLLDHLETERPYVAVAGPAGVGKARLAERTASRCGGRMIPDPMLSTPERPSVKSYGVTLQTEIEFVKRRSAALAEDAAVWRSGPPVWISDFWLHQSAAYLGVLAGESARNSLPSEWNDLLGRACSPTITVLLDAPALWCAESSMQRGVPRPNAQALQEREAIRQALIEQTMQPGHGPVLALDGRRPDDALDELAAAVISMK